VVVASILSMGEAHGEVAPAGRPVTEGRGGAPELVEGRRS